MQDNVTQALPVIQADREAAWPYRPSCYRDDPETKAFWMHGTYDKAGGVPIAAFAAHRLASTAQPEVKGLVEALERIEFLSTNHGGWFDQPGKQFKEYAHLGDLARQALAAYREAQP